MSKALIFWNVLVPKIFDNIIKDCRYSVKCKMTNIIYEPVQDPYKKIYNYIKCLLMLSSSSKVRLSYYSSRRLRYHLRASTPPLRHDPSILGLSFQVAAAINNQER